QQLLLILLATFCWQISVGNFLLLSAGLPAITFFSSGRLRALFLSLYASSLRFSHCHTSYDALGLNSVSKIDGQGSQFLYFDCFKSCIAGSAIKYPSRPRFRTWMMLGLGSLALTSPVVMNPPGGIGPKSCDILFFGKRC
ncbi:hypothetical protein T310_6567, partial [Rasamsonia emersonii CBS 393.64]